MHYKTEALETIFFIPNMNLDDIINENKKHHEKWPYIPDHPYRILIIGGSKSKKTNALLNLIKEQIFCLINEDLSEKIVTKHCY